MITAAIRVLAAALGAANGVQALVGFTGVAIGFGVFKLGFFLQMRAKSAASLATHRAATATRGAHNTGRDETTAIDEESLWAEALAEFEGESRRPGLWAQAIAESSGNESGAKARYLRARYDQLYQERKKSAQAREREAYLATLSEAERAYAVTPKGTCPSCDHIIPMASSECPNCRALFGSDSAWRIKPIAET